MISQTPNQAAPVNAPVAPWFHSGHFVRRVTEQQRSAMNTFRPFAVTVATTMLLAACDRDPAVVSIKEPCGTFVSEFAPNRTPILQRSDDGLLTLEVSFTPAKNREADRIRSAVNRHPVKLRVAKSGREIQALRLGSGSVLLSVRSSEEAEAVLEDLCFKKADLVKVEGS